MTTKTEDNSIFNTFVKYEQVTKARVKNAMACDKEIIPIDERKKLNKYTRLYTSSGYRIDYQFPESKDFGRVKEIPYTGLGTFSGPVRGYLANGIYLDVDMVNCHPTILRHEFKNKGIDTNIIDEYVDNRESFLALNGINKTDFLIMINKEDFNHPNEKIMKLHSQIYKIFIPSLLNDNQEILNSIKKSRTYNKMGTFIANYLQSIEFKILVQLHSFSLKQNIHIDVLMHDGFFVRITEQVNEKYMLDMLPKYSDFIKSKFNLEIKLKLKTHDLSLKIPDIENMTPLEINSETFFEFTKAESLKKFETMVYKKKNDHPMYYEDYYEEYNLMHKENPKDLRDLMNEVFTGDKLFNSCVKHSNQLFEYISMKRDIIDFPEMVRNSNYIAFKNGTLQLYPLKFFNFYELEELPQIKKFIARTYYDVEFNGSKETINLDKLILAQLSEESYSTLRILIGRLFFNLNIHDKWQVAPYIIGDPHTGKSTLMTLIEQCMGHENVGTLNKNDKVFQLSGIYNKDIVIVPDIKDCKSYIDEDIIQSIISGERTSIRCMRTTPFSHVWNKPILFGSNFKPDWSDTEGALRRRLIFFHFSNPVENKDSQLIERLLNERGNIINRCISEYFSFCETNSKEADFNLFIGEDLQNLKQEFKEFSDPLTEFLGLGRTKVGQYYYSIIYKKDSKALLSDFKKRFESWLSGTKHDQSFRMNSKHAEFKRNGFEYSEEKVCKSCGDKALKGCCSDYNRLNRTSIKYYKHMYMMKEPINGLNFSMNDE